MTSGCMQSVMQTQVKGEVCVFIFLHAQTCLYSQRKDPPPLLIPCRRYCDDADRLQVTDTLRSVLVFLHGFQVCHHSPIVCALRHSVCFHRMTGGKGEEGVKEEQQICTEHTRNCFLSLRSSTTRRMCQTVLEVLLFSKTQFNIFKCVCVWKGSASVSFM